MEQITFDMDIERSKVLIVDESDLPAVMDFKTANRIELSVWLKFTSPLHQNARISAVTPLLLQGRKFRKPKPIGDWIHSAREITCILEREGIILAAQSKDQELFFKWHCNLPEEFKYEWLDSKAFTRITMSVLGQLDFKKEFAIKWTGLRTGQFISK